MKTDWTILQLCAVAGCAMAALFMTASCKSLIFDDRSGCGHGVQMNFRYDYNLQRADMFDEHVGEVTVYVFDGQGRYVSTQIVDCDSSPEAADGTFVLDLPEGSYHLIALAQQDSYDGDASAPGAQFVRSEPGEGNYMTYVRVDLEAQDTDYYGGPKPIVHDGLPLDTVWHAWTPQPVTVGQVGYTEVDLSLVRNTKYISVSVRDLDGESRAADYDFTITDHNRYLLYDNSVDETDELLYTPFHTWDTEDRGSSEGSGVTAHAEFMTSRIIYHDDPADDARLRVVERAGGRTVIDVNLPDLLSSMASYDELHRYSPQEFLDRGYDYRLSFYLVDGDWSYATLTIGVLGWTKRIQNLDI